jgi:hypothetical protein
VAGLGVLLVSFVQTPEQLGPISAMLNIVMGVIGGAFGTGALLPLGYLSLIYWGTDAFTKLAAGNNDILLNLAVLLLEGALLFGIGLFLFNRRVEVV